LRYLTEIDAFSRNILHIRKPKINSVLLPTDIHTDLPKTVSRRFAGGNKILQETHQEMR